MKIIQILFFGNITWDMIKNNPDKPQRFGKVWFYIYDNKLVKQFIDLYWEELIKVSCHPKRLNKN